LGFYNEEGKKKNKDLSKNQLQTDSQKVFRAALGGKVKS
jgi:hypothetical protein